MIVRTGRCRQPPTTIAQASTPDPALTAASIPPTERKTGLEPIVEAQNTFRMRNGGLDLLREAA